MARKKLITLSEFRKFLFDMIVPVEILKDHQGQPIKKILTFWRKRKLVPFIPDGGHKMEISFSDLAWLRILDGLRAFGYPVEKQLLVSDYFFRDAYNHQLPKKNHEYNKKLLSEKKANGAITPEETRTLELIERYLKDETYLYALRFEINYLTNLITTCISEKNDGGILVFPDGTVGEKYGDLYSNHNGLSIDPTVPHIYFSVQKILSEFVENEQLAKLYLPQLLTEEENLVLRGIEENTVAEILIVGKDGSLKTYKSPAEGITAINKERIKTELCCNNYLSAEIRRRDRRTYCFPNTKSKCNLGALCEVYHGSPGKAEQKKVIVNKASK